MLFNKLTGMTNNYCKVLDGELHAQTCFVLEFTVCLCVCVCVQVCMCVPSLLLFLCFHPSASLPLWLLRGDCYGQTQLISLGCWTVFKWSLLNYWTQTKQKLYDFKLCSLCLSIVIRKIHIFVLCYSANLQIFLQHILCVSLSKVEHHNKKNCMLNGFLFQKMTSKQHESSM